VKLEKLKCSRYPSDAAKCGTALLRIASRGTVSDTGIKLLELKRTISERFGKDNWLELGAVTNSLDIVQQHRRLLRSLDFHDDDYDGNVLEVLIQILKRDPNNAALVERYLEEKFDEGGVNVSTTGYQRPKVYFIPSVFTVPPTGTEPDLISVMIPFAAEFAPVFAALQHALGGLGFRCLRAADIWRNSAVIQDIFALIWASRIVICDFSGRNPNVFYEAGIAHTLGKHVIPITQSPDDVPFDLRHHRFLRHLNNNEGLAALVHGVNERVRTLTGT
jgi:hypothetical protein